jgi:hypothetical protein
MFLYETPSEALKAGDFAEFKRMHAAGLTENNDKFLSDWSHDLFAQSPDIVVEPGAHLDCLKYLIKNGFNQDEYLTKNAAETGHLDCLKYAHEHGFDSIGCITAYGALSGDIEILKYLLSVGFQWHDRTTEMAAERGHLNILKWAHENGYQQNEWTPITCIIASRGFDECFEYCFEICADKQKFWKKDYDFYLEKMDFSKIIWRRLYDLDLSRFANLNKAVKTARYYIETLKRVSINAFNNKLNDNVINFVVNSFF